MERSRSNCLVKGARHGDFTARIFQICSKEGRFVVTKGMECFSKTWNEAYVTVQMRRRNPQSEG